MNTVHPAALGLVGTPFERGGRDFGTSGGSDCLGVTLEFVRRIGIDAGDPWAELESRWRFGVSDARPHARAQWARVDGPPRVGDVAVTKRGTHLAPYVGGGMVLEATENAGTVLMQVRRLPKDLEWWRRSDTS